MPPEFKIDNTAIALGLIVAPISSITALVIGAFRKFDDKDIRTMGAEFLTPR